MVKELIDQLEFVKIKNVCATEDTIKRKGQPQQGRKYLQVICLVRVYYPEYKKNIYNLTQNSI